MKCSCQPFTPCQEKYLASVLDITQKEAPWAHADRRVEKDWCFPTSSKQQRHSISGLSFDKRESQAHNPLSYQEISRSPSQSLVFACWGRMERGFLHPQEVRHGYISPTLLDR